MKNINEQLLFSLKIPNVLGQTGFNLHEAYTCLQLSQVSYLTLETQRKILRKNKFKSFKPFAKENTYAFTCVRSGILYIVFRGTDFSKIEDIYDNMDVEKVKMGVGKVHAGYKRHMDRVWKPLHAHIAKSKYNKIIVTGHSMGGAVGQIINSKLPGSLGYYFGAARSLDSKFVKKCKMHVYHIQNQYDIVTNLPPKFLFGFRLAGDKYILKYGELYYRNNTIWERIYPIFYMFIYLLFKLAAFIFGFKNWLRDILVKNHKIADYHRNLEAFVVKKTFDMLCHQKSIKKICN